MVSPGKYQEIAHLQSVENLCQLLRLDNSTYDWLDNMKSTDWPGIVKNATQLGFASLCYLQLKELGKLKSLQEGEQTSLKRSYLVARARAAQRIQDLAIVTQALGAVEIPVIFLKGAYLAEEIYRDRAVREMSDIDILVPKDKLDRTVEVLKELGYIPNRNFWTEFETRVSHQIPILIKPNHIPIEIHWTLFDPKLPFEVDPLDLWRRALPLDSTGVSGFRLSPEDLILHLTTHAASQHQLTGGLRFVYDTALVLNHFKDEINWSELKERSEAWHARASLYLMILLSQDIFGSGAPEHFMNAIQPEGFDQTWMQTAKDMLLLEPDDQPAFSGYLASMLEEQSLSKKIELFMDRVFISREELAEKYAVHPGSPFVFIYYLHHFRVLISRHFPSLIGFLGHNKSMLKSAKKSQIRKEKENYLQEHLTH